VKISLQLLAVSLQRVFSRYWLLRLKQPEFEKLPGVFDTKQNGPRRLGRGRSGFGAKPAAVRS
jgi:hypothetical protein